MLIPVHISKTWKNSLVSKRVQYTWYIIKTNSNMQHTFLDNTDKVLRVPSQQISTKPKPIWPRSITFHNEADLRLP